MERSISKDGSLTLLFDELQYKNQGKLWKDIRHKVCIVFQRLRGWEIQLARLADGRIFLSLFSAVRRGMKGYCNVPSRHSTIASYPQLYIPRRLPVYTTVVIASRLEG